MDLYARFVSKDQRALARAITWQETGTPAAQELRERLRGRGPTRVVGITGSPGSGKSTLTDHLIETLRARGETVAVLAVDPSSAFTGGAILGDRIRMMRHHKDPGVFIRSMASRGALGGLAGATVGALGLLEAFGFEWVLIETVGVGQSEVDITRVADSTILVLTPAAGDSVQAFKAGVMEIADIIVINKFDLPGGPRLVRELRSALEFAPAHPGDWRVPITTAVASEGKGTPELLKALLSHREMLEKHSLLKDQRMARARFEIQNIIQTWSRVHSQNGKQEVEAVVAGRLSPREAATALLKRALETEPESR